MSDAESALAIQYMACGGSSLNNVFVNKNGKQERQRSPNYPSQRKMLPNEDLGWNAAQHGNNNGWARHHH